MEYTIIDNKKLSKIALGAAEFGAYISKEKSFEIIDTYIENGGNLIDTGRVYSSWLEGGANASEKTIGEYIKSRNARDKLWILTKGGHPALDKMNVSRLNEEELTKDINESLYYLGVDYVDIYFLHRDDENIPVSKIMPILDKFVKEGKTKYIGASNWTIDRINEANKYARENNLTEFKFSEIMWSYAKFNLDAPHDNTLVIMNEKEYQGYLNSGVTLIAFSSQAQGFYSNVVYKGIDSLNDLQKQKFINDVNMERLEKIKEVSALSNVSPTALGLTPIIHNKLNAIPIIGGYNKELLLDSLQSLSVKEEHYKMLPELNN